VGATYEVVRSRIRAGAEEDMLELRPKMIAAVRNRFPELLDAHLIKMDDGTWMDVVRWTSRDAAERAAGAMSDIPEAQAMMGFIDEIVTFEHGVEHEPADARA
jgi:hypothetical protein